MAKDALPKLYKRDDQLGELTITPGTKAEYHQRLLEGWGEKKPAARQSTAQTAKQSGDKK